MKIFMKIAFPLVLLFSAFGTRAQKNDAPLASTAPQDKIVSINAGQLRQMDSVMAPYIAKARATYPGAKERFLKGLPPSEAFFVVTRIFDQDGKFEQVFIRVKDYAGENVSGTIANDLGTVREYKPNQMITFKEASVIDWLITKPDGSEEGNYIGKYLDTKQ